MAHCAKPLNEEYSVFTVITHPSTNSIKNLRAIPFLKTLIFFFIIGMFLLGKIKNNSANGAYVILPVIIILEANRYKTNFLVVILFE